MFEPQNIRQNDLSKKSAQETDFPIHSLEKDLEKIKKNPNYNPASFLDEKNSYREQAAEEKLTEKQKSSPFLKEQRSNIPQRKSVFQKVEVEARPKKEPTFQKPNPPIQQKKMPPIVSGGIKPSLNIPAEKESDKKITKNPEKTGSGQKLVMAFIIIIVAITIGGISFYYYKNINRDSEVSVAPETQETEIAENESEVAIENNIEQEEVTSNQEENNEEIFSLEKPNFLILNENFQAKETLKQYAQKVKEQEDKSLIEFIPVNKDYEPVSLSEFFSAMNIPLYGEISTSIDPEKDFSLFFFNDENQTTRLAVVIPLSKVNISLENHNTQLASNFESILLDEPKEKTDNTLQKATYKNIPINYINFKEGGNLSIDYFFMNNSLFLSTSKNTSFSLIDNFISQLE